MHKIMYFPISHHLPLYFQDERTALHEACRSQSSDEAGLESIARMLIEAGSDINAESTDMSFVIRGEKV